MCLQAKLQSCLLFLIHFVLLSKTMNIRNQNLKLCVCVCVCVCVSGEGKEGGCKYVCLDVETKNLLEIPDYWQIVMTDNN